MPPLLTCGIPGHSIAAVGAIKSSLWATAGGKGALHIHAETTALLSQAILFGGNDHLIELNDIHHVTTVTFDAGAIYAGRDLSSRGPPRPAAPLAARSVQRALFKYSNY